MIAQKTKRNQEKSHLTAQDYLKHMRGLSQVLSPRYFVVFAWIHIFNQILHIATFLLVFLVNVLLLKRLKDVFS